MGEAITLDHLVKKLEGLHDAMRKGELEHGEYDQRLARMITELRERKLVAERPEILSTLQDLEQRGVVTASVRSHIASRLGLA
ncbi:MAG: hypothetical protein OER90_14050 [Gemmatimonadota bacterium]|nr:hypothetical protein [Gemmatimonadota bacterium]